VNRKRDHQAVVIGGGAAGLAAAWALARAGADVALFEAGERSGGVIRSRHAEGWIFEEGPNSMAAPPPEVERMLVATGVASRRIEADPAARRRYVVTDGRPVALPASPLGIVGNPALPPRAIASILREPFRPARRVDEPESVAAFARRRFGPDVLERILDPLVTGIFAGDAEHLSMKHALPRLYDLEREHGSVICGALRSRRGGGRRRQIVSYPRGLAEITDSLSAALGDRIRTGAPIDFIERGADRWIVRTRTGEEARAAAVVIATPAADAARLAPDRALAAELAAVPHAPVAVVSLGYHRRDIAHPLDGFGMLVPHRERSEVLGVIFTSSVFPERAPPEHTLLTAIVGGTRSPDIVSGSPANIVARTIDGIRAALGITDGPVITHVCSWRPGIPQYSLDHGQLLDEVARVEALLPDLAFAGSYLHGVSVGDALMSGLRAADRILAAITGAELPSG
jgi:protoporphyrinogen/coproporphyrinogen III oxidase